MIKSVFRNKQIILGVSGGIAAYKSVELLRLLVKQDASVRVLMTKNACRFVGQTTFEALSDNRVCTSLFENNDSPISHIEWAQMADAVVIAPATANIIGKFANGIADDALSTFLLAVTAPTMFCPAMNTNMYESAPVQRNLERLRTDGYIVLEPGSGELACKTSGAGRLPDPEIIVDRLGACMTPKDLKGVRFVVTAGPTRESIDPVRFITNPSSGKMGYAIARAAEKRGAFVTLVSGPTNLSDPLNMNVIRVQSAAQMAEAVFAHADKAHVIVKSAAVADYRPKETAEHKVKKTEGDTVLHFERTVDILKELGRRKKDQILVGFAAETRELKEYAQKKLVQKNLDMIVGNLVNQPSSGFGTNTNQVTLFSKDGTVDNFPLMSKDNVADILLDRIAEKLVKRSAEPEK
ncbi:bifunctional phosphopantothenoylcysteine decarboxylase/phosphopantothenate--cysteine ligase CoaBC [Desulfobacterales bacterium HSG16]|nr:bifunctional phosphopantothenoylcysteine decarboxylase/phosphopantothenate--cysteine ligase CoaBC [Desulfobacterales bacterium HSG16]